jgi:hypothetical protein
MKGKAAGTNGAGTNGAGTNGVGTNGAGTKPETIKYFVLGGATNPYLLARVRWPDVGQAITAGCRNWLDDLGLFDLPYDPISAPVSFDQAAAIASEWGTSLPSAETAIECARPLIRRMPADWSRLTPAEKRAWALEFVPTGLRADAIRERAEAEDPHARRRRFPLRARRRKSDQVDQVDQVSEPAPAASTDSEETTDPVPVNGHAPEPVRAVLGSPAESPSPERRLHARVPARGRAQIRCGDRTVSATLVDVSQGGVRWRIFDADAALEVGEQLEPSLVLEEDGSGKEVSLDVGGTVMWGENTVVGAQFGVAFEPLSADQTDRVQHLLPSPAASRSA